MEDEREEYEAPLNFQIIAEGCKELEETLKPGCLAYVTCFLSKKGLTDISPLLAYPFLRHLELAGNQLTDVGCLGSLQLLESVDVSNNLLSTLFGFKAPLQLTSANYSHNLITSIGDVSGYWQLVHLNVSHNLIESLSGVEVLKYLRYLDISNNRLTSVDTFINGIPMETLNLSCNRIVNLGRVAALRQLRHLDIAFNHISTLRGVEDASRLEELRACSNHLQDLLKDIGYLCTTRRLRSVDLRGNLLCSTYSYRKIVLNAVELLEILDGEEVSLSEKACAHFEIRQDLLRGTLLLDMVSTVECSIIVLVGPAASRKRDVALRCNQDIIFVGKSHTTRQPNSQELDYAEYHFVTAAHFDQMLADGLFATCIRYMGGRNAISVEELQKVKTSQSGLFCVDLDAALQLRARYPQTKIITAWPSSESLHRRWLLQKFDEVSSNIEYFCANILEEIIDRIVNDAETSFENDVSRYSFCKEDIAESSVVGCKATERMSNQNNQNPNDNYEAQNYVTAFVEEQLQLRKEYELIFERNPGLRSAHIATDDAPESISRLVVSIAITDIALRITRRKIKEQQAKHIHKELFAGKLDDVIGQFA